MTAPTVQATTNPPFDQLDAIIRKGMKDYGIPGVAVGIIYEGSSWAPSYGVTNVEYPLPIDAETVFRIGSTTKTFTGTTMMRLVDQGMVDLNAPVRQYIPDFAVADESVSAAVTVRHLLNHTSGWNGDDVQDFGRGDDAIGRYVSAMTTMPQLTPLGTVFSYNNAGLVVAGRIIEKVTGTTYESAVQKLLLDPLKMNSTYYFSDQIIGSNVAASHDNDEAGQPVVNKEFWYFPRSCHSTGGLMSTVMDQLRYLKFHLGDGKGPDGTQLLKPESLAAMRSNPGAGGTLQVELTGMGVTWMLRPSIDNVTRKNVTIVQHGGTWAGQHSGFFLVPEKHFAMTVLTNSEGGTQLLNDLYARDSVLNGFAGVSNLPATRTAPDLSPYVGQYIGHETDLSGEVAPITVDWKAGDKQLVGTMVSGDDPPEKIGFAFYDSDSGPDYGLDLDENNKETGTRSDFIRGPDGKIAWFRSHGRLYRRQ
jgi:CubicO group peptidase (beta-lactamase class C family)